MKIATFTLKSTTPMSQSAPHQVPFEEGESHDAYDKRNWRHHMHVSSTGFLIMPAMAFKLGMTAAAQFGGKKIKGEGQKTWTKRFESGILIIEDLMTDIRVKSADLTKWADHPLVIPECLYLNADGKRGSAKRVWRTYPRIEEWSGVLVINVLDDKITEAVCVETLETMGKFIGIGRWSAARGGLYGRFSIESHVWVDEAKTSSVAA